MMDRGADRIFGNFRADFRPSHGKKTNAAAQSYSCQFENVRDRQTRRQILSLIGGFHYL